MKRTKERTHESSAGAVDAFPPFKWLGLGALGLLLATAGRAAPVNGSVTLKATSTGVYYFEITDPDRIDFIQVRDAFSGTIEASSSGLCGRTNWLIALPTAVDHTQHRHFIYYRDCGSPRPAIDKYFTFANPAPQQGQFLKTTGFDITSQPLSQSTCAGGEAAFQVTAPSPAPVRFQWFFDGNPVSNATNATLTLHNVQPGDAGNYAVEVSENLAEVRTFPASLTVLTAPIVTQQPTNTLSGGCSPVVFSAHATGTGSLTYQWQRSDNGGASFTDIVGTTNATLTLGFVSLADNGAQFRAIVRNECGSTTSAAATLTAVLDSTPPRIVCVVPICNTNICIVRFSEDMEQTRAEDYFNYRIQEDDGSFESAVVADDGQTVFLWGFLSFTAGNSYTLQACHLSDVCGNESIQTTGTFGCPTQQNVTVTCPSNLLVECSGSSMTPVDYSVSAISTASSNVTIYCLPPSGSPFPVGTSTVTCVGIDDQCNGASCSFTVQVDECPAPSLRLRLDGANAVLTWPKRAIQYELQVRSTLSESAPWATVAAAPVLEGNQFKVTVPAANRTGFFRLRPKL